MKPLILVVDPYVHTCTVLKLILEHEGQTVLCTGEGREALKLAAECRPSIIILEDSDLLPERSAFVDGLAADSRTATIPVIRFAPSLEARFQREQSSPLALVKPVGAEVVADVVKAFIRAAENKRSVSGKIE